MKPYFGSSSSNELMSERVKIGSGEHKKELLFFIEALRFNFKCFAKWRFVKATGTAQSSKANDWREKAELITPLGYIGNISVKL